MKKLSLFAVFLLVFSSSRGQVAVGVTGGAGFFYFTGKGAEEKDLDQNQVLKPGWSGGLTGQYKLSKYLSLQMNVLYSKEGNLQKPANQEIRYKLDYLNVPVTMQYNHTSGIYAETGPQAGFLLSAKHKKDDGVETTEENKYGFKKMTFSWVGGMGYKARNGISFNARYQWGLTSFDKVYSVKSNGFYFTFTYILKRIKL